MSTQNAVNTTLSGQTGTGTFVGATSPTLTTPRIAQINDSNGNAIISTVVTGSAVNNLEFGNSATGSPVFMQAIGSDTNIAIQYVTKGTQSHNFYTTGTTGQLLILSGAAYVNSTTLNFPAASVTFTFPTFTGTMAVISKANGTESSNAVTASGSAGVITTSSLTTAGGSSYAITWTNTFISATSVILLTIMGGTNTVKNITLQATAGSGTSTLTIYNNTTATALNGTIFIGYRVV